MGEGMKKPVVFFLPDLQGGGAEKATVRIICALLARGIHSELLLLNTEGVYFGELPESYPITSLDAGNLRFYPNYLFAFPRLVFFLHKRESGVIISNLSHLNVMLLFARILSRKQVKIIAVEHNNFSTVIRNTSKFSPKFLPPLMRWLYPKADFIVGVSQGVVEDLKRVLRFGSEKFRVIYNPIVDDRLLKKAEEPLDHPWFREGESPVILAAGRLHISKDFPTLLRAFALVRKQIPARLVILGEGEERKELENLAQELGIREDLDLPGFVENPYKYMKRATVFVLSSQWEGLPTVLVEAMACGCPVVATDCPSGPAELLENGKWGRLVPPGDPEALAKAILDTLEGGVSRVEAATNVQKRFSMIAIVEQYLKVLGFS